MTDPPPTSTTTTSPMPPSSLPRLTLIVATTPTLGIGLRGSLPWPPLKSDLAFFARVTKRPTPAHSKAQNTTPVGRGAGGKGEVRNAVIMGRKTWESIPPKFRPLRGRINVVVTRQGGGKLRLGDEGPGEGKEAVFAVGSVEAGLRELKGRYGASGSNEDEKESTVEAGRFGEAHKGKVRLGRVFVIGGAEIYRIVLGMEECERVLWTRLGRDFECDTFFPEGVLKDEGAEGGEWERRSSGALDEWTGEEGAGELKKESDVEFSVIMMEKRR